MVSELTSKPALDGTGAEPQPRLFWVGASATLVALTGIVLFIWQPASRSSTDVADPAVAASAMGRSDADRSLDLSAVVFQIVDDARKRLVNVPDNVEHRTAGAPADVASVPVAAPVSVPVDADAGVTPDRDSSTSTVGDGGDEQENPITPSPNGIWDSDL